MDANDCERERARMVGKQIEARGVTSASVLRAMREVPRHLFVPEALRNKAYHDRPLSIGFGQTISQPYMVAVMTELLGLEPDHRVLEIGTGSAYQTAVLASLAGVVVSVEREIRLVKRARRLLHQIGCSNAVVNLGDGSMGCAEYGPYDAILVTAGSPRVPQPLLDQLAHSGKLICPVGTRNAQKIVRLQRTARGFKKESGIGCVFVPLIGQEGWCD